MENRVDISEAGLKTAAKNFTSSINPFEKKANEYKKLISDKKFIIVKNTYSCFCYDNCKKKTDYFYIRGQNMTYRYVIEQLIYQGLQLDCDHRYLEGFYKKDDSDCQFEIWTGS
jgi:hypothetical protein